MATSKAEKLRLLFKDDLVGGQLPKVPVPVEETEQETTSFEETTLIDSTTSHTNHEIPASYPNYGENIEPVGYNSGDENVPTSGSVTASGKRKAKKKGKQGPTTISKHTAVIRSEASDNTPGPGLQLGELGLNGEKFCPILAVSRYPYRNLGKDLSEVVADSYFNAGKFWERTWDM